MLSARTSLWMGICMQNALLCHQPPCPCGFSRSWLLETPHSQRSENAAKDDSTRLVEDLEYWICFFSSKNWHQMQHSMVHNNGENYLAVQNQAKLPLCWPEDYEGNTGLITKENLSRAFWFANHPAWQTPSFFLSSLHNEEKSFNLYAISLNRN